MSIEARSLDEKTSAEQEELLTLYINGQQFGIPILQVQDVLRPQLVTPIPLSSPEIQGALNLRGRIVTAIDMRTRLRLPASDIQKSPMSVVVEHEHELFSLLVDKIGDVMRLKKDKFDKIPSTLDPIWQEVANGIYRLDGTLLVVLDIKKLLNFDKN